MGLLGFSLVLTPVIAWSSTAFADGEITPDSGIYHHHYYNVGSLRMHAVDVGDPSAPTVVLMHGAPGDWTQWQTVLSDSSLNHSLHMIAIDLPGFGQSGTAGDAVTSLKTQVELLRPALQLSQGHGPSILVGYSYSGAIAARWAMDFPLDFQTVFLISPCVDPRLEKPQWYEQTTQWPILNELMKLVQPDWVTEGAGAVALPSELQKMLPMWPRFTARVFETHGSQDHTVSLKADDFLKRELTNTTLIRQRVHGLDHLVLERRPDLLIQNIRYLSGLSAQMPTAADLTYLP
jgi:pimeloyl-ACP methyl ester carboxylesterase